MTRNELEDLLDDYYYARCEYNEMVCRSDNVHWSEGNERKAYEEMHNIEEKILCILPDDETCTHVNDYMNYEPVCPYGYADCIHDPAYILANYPERYEGLYDGMDLKEAAQQCMKESTKGSVQECCPDYDDEDK